MTNFLKTSAAEHHLIENALPADARKNIAETRLVVENGGLSLRAQAKVGGSWTAVDQSVSEMIASRRIASEPFRPAPPTPARTAAQATHRQNLAHNESGKVDGIASASREEQPSRQKVALPKFTVSQEKADNSWQSEAETNLQLSLLERAVIKAALPKEWRKSVKETRLVLGEDGLIKDAQAKVGEAWTTVDPSVIKTIVAARKGHPPSPVYSVDAASPPQSSSGNVGRLQNVRPEFAASTKAPSIGSVPEALDSRHEQVSAYLRKMGRAKEWGTGVEVQALANVFGRDIHIVSRTYAYDAISDSTKSSFHLLKFYPEGKRRQGPPIGLTLSGMGELSAGGHYEALRAGSLDGPEVWTDARLNKSSLSVAGDGDCLFASVAKLMSVSTEEARRSAVSWLQDNIFLVKAQNQPLDSLADVALLFET